LGHKPFWFGLIFVLYPFIFAGQSIQWRKGKEIGPELVNVTAFAKLFKVS
jgi:hypothetical protein